MRTLQLHFPDDALATLHTVLKQTKDARVFRRAQAVHEVVKGTRLHTGSDTRAFPSSTLSTWAHHFAQAGAPGLVGRPRSGRPPTVTVCSRHAAQSPHRARASTTWLPYSQWSGRALATVLAAHGTARPRRGSVQHFSRRPVGPARRRGLQPGGTRGRTVWTGTAAGGTARGGASHAA